MGADSQANKESKSYTMAAIATIAARSLKRARAEDNNIVGEFPS